jgi:hypothetical protein
MKTWSGQFSSSIYPMGFATGIIEVVIDADQQEYSTPFKVIYSGIYNNRKEIKSEAQVEGNNVEAKFPNGQQLIFLIRKRSEDRIEGEYTSSGPTDRGHFTLTPTPLNDHNINYCVLM